MLFNSVTFLYYFLPLFLLAYFCVPFRNVALLLASLFFYAWGEPGYFALLVFSIVMNFGFGLLLDSRRESVARWALPIGVGANLLLLVWRGRTPFYPSGRKRRSVLLKSNGAAPLTCRILMQN